MHRPVFAPASSGPCKTHSDGRSATTSIGESARSLVHWEPVIWIALAPLFPIHEWLGGLLAIAAIGRLCSLGPEGWLFLYLAGQPVVHAGLIAMEIDLPVLAITGLLTNAICAGYWATTRKAIPVILTLVAFLAVFAVAATAMLTTTNELTFLLEQRIQLFLSQALAAIQVILIFARRSPRLDRLCVASGITLCGVAGGMILSGAALFSRMHDTPLIDWGRASAMAALSFLVAAAFSARWRATAYLGLGGVGSLLSVSQLLRQSAYAAVLSLAVCAVAFRHVHRFHLGRLMASLGLAAFGVALLQGDMLEEKLSRFLGRGDGAEVSNAARDKVAALATDMIQEQPIVGAGFGGFSRELGYDYYPHNMVLEILCEFGVVGLVIGCLPVAFGMLLLRPRPDGPPGGEIALVSLMGFWTLVSQASYSLPHSCACFPGMLVAYLCWRRTQPPLSPAALGVQAPKLAAT